MPRSPLVPALLVLLATATPHRAAAQADPETGDVEASQAPSPRTGPAPSVRAEREPATAAAASTVGAAPGDAAPDPATLTDHHAVVGRFGVGFFGVRAVPSGPVDPTDGDLASVDAPSIGVRHWFDDLLGLELALGLGFRSLSSTSDGSSRNLARLYGLVLHGALPITLYHYRHYAFLVIPETNLGLGGGSRGSTGGDDAFFGVLWDLGVRLGAELHFGFIGVPDLSLQASVGVRLRVRHGRQELCDAATECDTTTEARVTEIDVATTVDGDPWDIFTGAITAIYYF